MKLADIKPPQIALVTWLDTAQYAGWYGSRDDVPDEPLKMKTVGWLIERNKKVIVLAMTAGEFRMGDFLVIPASCVQAVDLLPPEEDTQG